MVGFPREVRVLTKNKILLKIGSLRKVYKLLAWDWKIVDSLRGSHQINFCVFRKKTEETMENSDSEDDPIFTPIKSRKSRGKNK